MILNGNFVKTKEREWVKLPLQTTYPSMSSTEGVPEAGTVKH